jgi:uncharacterized membrane protein
MSNFEISTNPAERGNANLIYVLYLVGIAAGITAIVGVVMAYLAQDSAPDWLKTHYRNQINIFWKALLYSVVGGVLCVVLIGFAILAVAFVWYIVRVVRGVQTLAKGEPVADPASWGF